MNPQKIVITFMEPHEISSAQRFVNDAMKKQYGCDAYPLPERVLVARCSGSILGTLAIAESSYGSLPIERLYEIDTRSFPEGKHPGVDSLIQFGRWVGREPRVSRILLYEAARYSLARHYVWAMSEVKPQVVRRFRQMGIRLSVLSATVKAEQIPVSVRPYYDSPFPVLAMARLREVEAALR